MKVIYIAGPFRAYSAWSIEQNVRRAEELGLSVAWQKMMPVIPHANTRFFHGQMTEKFWLDGTMELLKRCDAVLLVHGWKKSEGAVAEVKTAQERGIPVFDNLACLVLWKEGRPFPAFQPNS